MIHWYRAAMRHPPRTPADSRIRVPTLVVWGEQDSALDAALASASLAYCDHGRLELIEEATHWVQHEETVRVNDALRHFLRAEAGA
jgi:pimeloyl-ACP methyl ester carboxylesterase